MSGARRWKRLAAGAVVVLLVAAAAAAGVGYYLLRRAWPQAEGRLAVAGLGAPVEVVRDRWGVPHLYAGSDEDVLFAQGFAHGQDRLWQMEFGRRAGSGRLAAVLGEDLLPFDRATRVLDLAGAAEREWQAMDAATRALLEAYARGVNAAIDAGRGRRGLEFRLLGVEPEPWRPTDSLVLVKLMYWILSENASFEVSRARFLASVGPAVAAALLPPYSDGAPVIVPRELGGYGWARHTTLEGFRELAPVLGVPGPGQGSNNWVVHGSRTATGRPLLANDTHLELFLPSAWYTNALHGGSFDAIGYSLAGAPGIVLGHNGRIAWGVSDLVPDIQDFYIEQLDDPEAPRRYRFRGGWRDLEVDRHTIDVDGGEPVVLEVLRTHHGPLVNDFVTGLEDAEPMALAWTGREGRTLMRSLLDLARAGDWQQFRAALALWDGPHMNFVYADADGNIGYQAAGRVPIRAPGHEGAVPVPGWSGDHEWGEPIPFDELPSLFNPPAGFIVTANQKVVDDEYPYKLGHEWADPFRALRIEQVLAAEERSSLESSARLQGDTHHLPAEALRPYLLAVRPEGELEERVLDLVRRWNLRADPGEAGAAIYQVWYRALLRRTVADELGPELMEDYLEYYWVHVPVMVRLVAEGASPLFDDVSTPVRESRDDVAAAAFRDAVAWLAERYGDDPEQWQWGKLHTLTFRPRPLGLAGIPVLSELVSHGPMPSPGGDRFTVNAAWLTVYDEEAPFAADAGAAQRLLVDVGDWDASLGINSTGQSEHLLHPHRVDQTALWRDLRYHPLPFTRPAVEAVSAAVLELVPEPAP